MQSKLKLGDVILIHGWVMLAGLEDGCAYRVIKTEPYRGEPTYTFKRVGGRKLVRHYACGSRGVDLWIDEGSPDTNWIEITSQKNPWRSRSQAQLSSV